METSNSAAGCLLTVLDEVADDIGLNDLDACCVELASRGRAWTGYPEMPIACDVLLLPDETKVALWHLACEPVRAEHDMHTSSLGELIDACELGTLPAWFQRSWMKVYDAQDDRWRPLWNVDADEPCLQGFDRDPLGRASLRPA